MAQTFSSIKKPSLSKEVERQLKQSIHAGVYGPGDKLPAERELVEQFEVSRATVRDALKNLQSMGLIEIKRGINAGAYVLAPNPLPITQSFENLIQMKKVSFAHLIEIRLFIEPNVTASAAARRTPEDIAMLTGLLDRAEQRLATNVKEARLINVRFHDKVAKITANPLIIFLSQSITQVCSASLIKMTQDAVDAATVKGLIGKHRSILQSIIDRKPGEAFDKTKLHLIETQEMYARSIPAEGTLGAHDFDLIKDEKAGNLIDLFLARGVRIEEP
jgi:GntR family transcriptional repressor for pyruvate dehydrogenase complex